MFLTRHEDIRWTLDTNIGASVARFETGTTSSISMYSVVIAVATTTPLPTVLYDGISEGGAMDQIESIELELRVGRGGETSK